MKDIHARKQLESDQNPTSIINTSSQSSNTIVSINEQTSEGHKPNMNLMFPMTKQPRPVSQETFKCQNISLEHECTKAKDYLSTIEDPLWKRICQDVLKTMGPASFLEIWECILGTTTSRNKSIDIYCPTEKAAQFIKQYSFVFLGCLKTYFPSLKEINVRIILP